MLLVGGFKWCLCQHEIRGLCQDGALAHQMTGRDAEVSAEVSDFRPRFLLSIMFGFSVLGNMYPPETWGPSKGGTSLHTGCCLQGVAMQIMGSMVGL